MILLLFKQSLKLISKCAMCEVLPISSYRRNVIPLQYSVSKQKCNILLHMGAITGSKSP